MNFEALSACPRISPAEALIVDSVLQTASSNSTASMPSRGFTEIRIRSRIPVRRTVSQPACLSQGQCLPRINSQLQGITSNPTGASAEALFIDFGLQAHYRNSTERTAINSPLPRKRKMSTLAYKDPTEIRQSVRPEAPRFRGSAKRRPGRTTNFPRFDSNRRRREKCIISDWRHTRQDGAKQLTPIHVSKDVYLGLRQLGQLHVLLINDTVTGLQERVHAEGIGRVGIRHRIDGPIVGNRRDLGPSLSS
jgi:hypothetical protein